MTKYIVDGVINEFNKHGNMIDCFKIEDTRNAVLSEYDLFGIAYPVHSFNAPKIVINFVQRLSKSNGVKTFIIHTAGENAKVNYASSDLMIKMLKRKGYDVFYNKLIEMPSNFIVKYDDKKVIQIIKKANEDIPRIAHEIMTITPYAMKKTIGSQITAVIGRIEWFGARMMGKLFCASGDCTRCGKCADNCPNQNIILNKKRVRFKRHCGLCMRCIYQCPENAICVRQPFKFICFEKWYDDDLFQ